MSEYYVKGNIASSTVHIELTTVHYVTNLPQERGVPFGAGLVVLAVHVVLAFILNQHLYAIKGQIV